MPGVFSEVECRRVNWGKDRKEGGAEAESTLSGAIKMPPPIPGYSWVLMSYI